MLFLEVAGGSIKIRKHRLKHVWFLLQIKALEAEAKMQVCKHSPRRGTQNTLINHQHVHANQVTYNHFRIAARCFGERGRGAEHTGSHGRLWGGVDSGKIPGGRDPNWGRVGLEQRVSQGLTLLPSQCCPSRNCFFCITNKALLSVSKIIDVSMNIDE